MVDVNVNTTLDVGGTASKHCAGFSHKQGRMIYIMYAFILNNILQLALDQNFNKCKGSITFCADSSSKFEACPLFYDDVLCWPPTPINSTHRISCTIALKALDFGIHIISEDGKRTYNIKQNIIYLAYYISADIVHNIELIYVLQLSHFVSAHLMGLGKGQQTTISV